MFYILCTTIILLMTFSGWGRLCSIFSKNKDYQISILTLKGIATVNMLLVLVAFFFPLNIFIEIFVLSAGIFGFFYFKIYLKFYQLFSQNYSLWLICGLITLAASFYPFILDHFGYYVPTINVLKSFGLVKGIANLDLILGQMSFWHVLSAGFSNFSDTFLRINAVALMVYVLYAVERKNYLHLIFVPIFLLFVQSPSPDLPVLVFSLILVDELIRGNRNAVWLFALACYIFTIKPTMLWAPLMVLLYMFLPKNWSKFTLGGIIVLIFFIKNIWCFGYPVFPVQIGNIGVEWTPNAALMKASAQTAIMKTYDMQYSFQEIQRFTAWDFVWKWLTLSGMKSIINILFLITLILLTGFAARKKSRLVYIIVASVLIKSIAVLMFSAQYRFFLDVFLVVIFLVSNSKIKADYSKLIGVLGSMVVVSTLMFPSLIQKAVSSFHLGNFMKSFEVKQFYKPSDYEATAYKTFKIGDLKFNVADKYPFSYKTPAPAISQSFIRDYMEEGIFPRLIGKDLNSGVTWRKISEKEKQKLQHILQDSSYKMRKEVK